MTAFWSGLSPRERTLIGVAAAILVLVGGWYGVVNPLLSARANAERAWLRTGDDLVNVERAAARARAATGAPQKQQNSRPANQSAAGLRAATAGAARAAGLSISRLQPEGETAVRVWIDEAPATDVYDWLLKAEREHGLSVQEASLVSRRGDGRVSVEVTLSAGA